jgi:hypothetical protein
MTLTNAEFQRLKIADAIKRLKEAAEHDQEVAHIKADEIILEFVPPEVAEEYKKIPKWYA